MFRGVLIAGALQVFIATDGLTALLPLLALWLATLCAVALAVVRAWRREDAPAAAGLWAGAAWLAVSGLALPVGLLVATGDGALRAC